MDTIRKTKIPVLSGGKTEITPIRYLQPASRLGFFKLQIRQQPEMGAGGAYIGIMPIFFEEVKHI